MCVCACGCVFVCMRSSIWCLFFLFVSFLPPPLLSEEKLRNQSKIHQDFPAHKPPLPSSTSPPHLPSTQHTHTPHSCFLCCRRLKIGWDVRLVGSWSGADMNCVSPRQERSSPLALTECISLLSGALLHLPTANGKAADRREGSAEICVEERKEWQHVGYKFIVSHHPAGPGMAGSDCWDGGSEVGILSSE